MHFQTSPIAFFIAMAHWVIERDDVSSLIILG